MRTFWKAVGITAAIVFLAAALICGLYFALKNGPMRPSGSKLPRNKLDPDQYTVNDNGIVSCPGARQGIDVSSHQGEIDWNAVKAAGFDFAIIRIGYRGYSAGSVNIDEMFEQNYSEAIAAGLDVGVYFYSQAVSVAEAKEEAAFVVETLSKRSLTLPVFFDWEEVSQGRTGGKADSEVSSFAKQFCQTIEIAGYRAGVYFNQSYGYTIMRLSQMKNYDFWLAEYNDYQSFTYQVRFWQYTCNGHIDGVSTRVDLDLMYPEEPEE